MNDPRDEDWYGDFLDWEANRGENQLLIEDFYLLEGNDESN